MFVPQKDDFAYHLFRTGFDALPTRFAILGICPHMTGIDFPYIFAYSVFHLNEFVQ